MTHLMIDERIVINHLVLVGNHTTIAEALSSLALEYEVEAVAGNTVMKRDDVMVYTAGKSTEGASKSREVCP
jgi:hypothetical protein